MFDVFSQNIQIREKGAEYDVWCNIEGQVRVDRRVVYVTVFKEVWACIEKRRGTEVGRVLIMKVAGMRGRG